MPQSRPMPFDARLVARRWCLFGRIGLGLIGALVAQATWAQGLACSSDGQRAPRALWERFMDADCSACWTAAQAMPPPGTAVLDWVRPLAKAEEAPLSAVALSEADDRYAVLGLQSSTLLAGQSNTHLSRRHGNHALRVVQGVAISGYLGATLSFRPPSNRPYTAWMLLVEHLPAGTEDSVLPRHLVRAAVEIRPASQGGRVLGLSDTRAFWVPPGAQPERLRVLAWVQDGQARLLALGQTHCP